MTTTINRYLAGNFGPVRDELTVTELEVTGHLPAHLDGRYVRNGPNPLAEADPNRYHWFTGDGMVHGVRIRDGRAEWYRNRWIRSTKVAAGLGEAPRRGAPHAGMDFASNTNVIEHAGATLALVEGGARPYELTDELDTVGICDFNGTLDGGFAAHPHLDPSTGELHAVTYYWGWGNKVRYVVVGTDGRVRRSVDIPVTGSPMMHDFSLTEDYVVLYDLPVTLDLDLASGRSTPARMRSVLPKLIGKLPGPVLGLLARGGGDPTSAFPYSWDNDYPARIGLLPRQGSARDVRWFDVEPCYVFHPMNAYQEGGDVVLDVVRHPRMFVSDRTGLNGHVDGSPSLHRWTVDIAAGKVREEQVHDGVVEFPRVDERLTGRRHRYGYAVGIDDDLDVAHSVVRHDLVTRNTTVRSLGEGRQPGEFVFVPNSANAPEDDGVLMGFVYDAVRDRSDLELLDAATLETVATVHLPVRVPHGFHGNWMPTTSA